MSIYYIVLFLATLIITGAYILIGVWLGYKAGRGEVLREKEYDNTDLIELGPDASTVGYFEDEDEEK
jgi:hypothetical protein